MSHIYALFTLAQKAQKYNFINICIHSWTLDVSIYYCAWLNSDREFFASFFDTSVICFIQYNVLSPLEQAFQKFLRIVGPMFDSKEWPLASTFQTILSDVILLEMAE